MRTLFTGITVVALRVLSHRLEITSLQEEGTIWLWFGNPISLTQIKSVLIRLWERRLRRPKLKLLRKIGLVELSLNPVRLLLRKLGTKDLQRAGIRKTKIALTPKIKKSFSHKLTLLSMKRMSSMDNFRKNRVFNLKKGNTNNLQEM